METFLNTISYEKVNQFVIINDTTLSYEKVNQFVIINDQLNNELYRRSLSSMVDIKKISFPLQNLMAYHDR